MIMNLQERINAFTDLGKKIRSILDQLSEKEDSASGSDSDFRQVAAQAGLKNQWFTMDNICLALENWSKTLTREHLETWLKTYQAALETPREIKRVGVVNAGNIPFVGLHDLISVLLAGHSYTGKNASDDPFLLPFIAELLIEVEPRFRERIHFVDRLKDIDAVIATGSDNTSRYFDYYFGKYPHIIRKNRNGVAVLSGSESPEELTMLGEDIFSYFGLGCRNVSKMYVPKDYNFNLFFESIFSFYEKLQHNKYLNNFDYNNAVLLLKRIPFLQNGFLIIHEDQRITSPIAVLHYEYYIDKDKLAADLNGKSEQIQCVLTSTWSFLKADPSFKLPIVKFGQSQQPKLWDYADGVDTMEFLLTL
jgi:hypothetical protein